MCLVSRRADLPNVEHEIQRYWSSLDSVTGKNILFVFSSQKDSSEKIIKKIKGRPTQFEIPKAIEFPSNRSESQELKSKLISDFTKENYEKFNLWNGKWYLGQELQTNQIASFFGLKEIDIPCLHLTFLIPGFEYVIKINEPEDIYSLSKKIIETLDAGNYEGILNEIKGLISKKQELEKYISDFYKHKHFYSYDNLNSLIKKHVFEEKIERVLSQILISNPANSISLSSLEKHIRFLKKSSEFKPLYKEYKKDFKNIHDVLKGNCPAVNISEYYQDINEARDELELTKKTIYNKLSNSKTHLIKTLRKELKEYETSNLANEGIIQKVISTLELKPNAFGLGINLNQMIELLFFKK